MFLRVQVRQANRDPQRFLWRGIQRDCDPEIFRVTRLTFGERSAPSSAIHILNENTRTFEEKKPRAVAAILSKFYVDDYLDSFSSVDEARSVIRDVQCINERGGFHMHALSSNKLEILEDLALGSENEAVALFESANELAKTFGLNWNPKSDMLSFEIERTLKNANFDDSPPTKRKILRVVMSIFDPLGFASPFIITGRILLQKLWKSKVNWDSKISEMDEKTWRKLTEELRNSRTVVCREVIFYPTKIR